MESLKDLKIYSHLRCIKCGHMLASVENQWVCNSCSQHYPVIDGIPDFILEDMPYQPKSINLCEKYEIINFTERQFFQCVAKEKDPGTR